MMEFESLANNELLVIKNGHPGSFEEISKTNEVKELAYRQGASGKPVKSPHGALS
jgi:hypothetical protein